MAIKGVKFLYDEQLNRPASTIRVYNPIKGHELVLKAFYQEDFHLNITNNWSTGDSTIFKQLVDSATSVITSRSGKVINHYAQKGLDMVMSGMSPSDDGYELAKKAKGFLEDAQGYQNSVMFTADDFYKSFKGTTVTFPLNISFTLVSDEVEPDEADDVYTKLGKIFDVSVGDFKTAIGILGIQMAPNNFDSGGYDITSDSLLKGSLKVAYGDPSKGGFILTNMLISNVHCTFSKSKVEIRPNVWRPLFIDVQVMLEPGRKFTLVDIKKNLGIDVVKNTKTSKVAYSNRKTTKEISEAETSQQQEIDALESVQNIATINANVTKFLEDNGYENVEWSYDEGVLSFNGEFDNPEDYTEFNDKFNLASNEGKELPGVDSVELSFTLPNPEFDPNFVYPPDRAPFTMPDVPVPIEQPDPMGWWKEGTSGLPVTEDDYKASPTIKKTNTVWYSFGGASAKDKNRASSTLNPFTSRYSSPYTKFY